jgi:NAD(P)-dependent dehydrogenase (short-subunit alcohol dehydrogenase family)
MVKQSNTSSAGGGRLQGKVALITGAGAGIGEASVLRFCREGATVVASDRDGPAAERVAEAARKAGGSAHALTCDVTHLDDCRQVVKYARERFGKIDVLFNVAGIVHGGNMLKAHLHDLRKAFEINIVGMFHMARQVLPIMVEGGGGSIINVGSVAGPHAVKDRGVYSITKSAVIGLTKSIAMDFVDKKIRCNVICPGTVETPSWHQRVKDSPDPEAALKMMIARQPMGRVGQPEEIAGLAVYLASDESAYMTGQALYIDGGMTM